MDLFFRTMGRLRITIEATEAQNKLCDSYKKVRTKETTQKEYYINAISIQHIAVHRVSCILLLSFL